MTWHDGLTPVSEENAFDGFLISQGFNGAKNHGLLRQYMRMMNKGGSGGYTEKHLLDAAVTDSWWHSDEWRAAQMKHIKEIEKGRI